MSNDIFTPEILSECSLIQAMEYLAFGWEPLNEDYENALDNPRKRLPYFSYKEPDLWDGPELSEKRYITEMKKAEAKVKILLKKEFPFYAYVYENYSDDDKEHLEKNGRTYKLLSKEFPYCLHQYNIDFDEDCGITVMNLSKDSISLARFGIISFDFQKLKEIIEDTKEPETKAATAPANSSYTTPHLTLINTMISKGYVTAENQPLAKNLQKDIEKEAKALNIKISNKLKEAMSTILRLPETHKGGLKKSKP